MKIGIITFSSAHNYGAVLQAWALQEYLEKQGNTVEIINYRLAAIDNVYRLFAPESPYKSELRNRLHQRKQLKKVKKSNPARVETYRKFERFIAQTLHTTQEYHSVAQLKNATFDFDVLITGSDQVWNCNLTKGINPAYLLDFGPEQAKRISYAVSIGEKQVTEANRLIFQRNLRNFDYISVREQTAYAEIAPLTSKEVEITCDPTLLLQSNEFDRLRIDPPKRERFIYVHNVHLRKVDTRLNQVAEELSARTGLPVIANRANYQFKNRLPEFLGGGPNEFLGMVANAEYVVTNSFHATTFSLLYHRNFITIPALNNPARMQSLLERLELENHLIDRPELIPELKQLDIDYDKVERLRAEYAKHSEEFLERALKGPKTAFMNSLQERSFLNSEDKFGCSGCGSCVERCTDGSVWMEEDSEGFLYPAADFEHCSEGTKKSCVENCARLHEEIKQEAGREADEMYLALYLDKDVPKRTFFGSPLKPFCEAVLEAGGELVAKAFDEKMQFSFVSIHTKEELERIWRALPIGADLSKAKELIRTCVQQNKPVLFLGNPCETSVIRLEFLDYDKLYTVETICNGVTSVKVFEKYREALEQQYGATMTDITFQHLIRGWKTPYLYAKFSSDEVKLEARGKNLLYKAFQKHRISRLSCYSCTYVGNRRNSADLSIGTYLGKEQRTTNKYEGQFIIKVNTRNGKRLLEHCKGAFTLEPMEYDDLYTAEQKKHAGMTQSRNSIMSKLDKTNILTLLKAK